MVEGARGFSQKTSKPLLVGGTIPKAESDESKRECGYVLLTLMRWGDRNKIKIINSSILQA